MPAAAVKQNSRTFPVMIQTCLPSVIGEGDDEFCFRNSWLPESTVARHFSLPVLRSRASRKILSLDVSPLRLSFLVS